jgi:uncharacterized sulfatase
LEELDQSVGKLVAAVDRLGLGERTIILFLSDNGGLVHEQNGRIVTSNQPLRGEKGTLYEGGIRIPAIARWTGHIPSAAVCQTPAITMDVYPTLLELAAASASNNQPLDGTSLKALLADPAKLLPRDSLYWHLPHYHHSTPASAVRRGDWKLIEFFEDDSVELYDLRNDPGETRNVASEHSETVQQLRAELAAWRAKVQAQMPRPNPNYDAARANELAKGKGKQSDS